MSIPRTILFIDGENLVFRYEAMLAEGRKPDPGVIHIPGVFVWHPQITQWCLLDVVRVYFYTSTSGDDDKLVALREKIGGTTYKYDYQLGDDYSGTAQLVPVVFKKLASSRKSRLVDIHIAIDMMRFSHNASIQNLFLVSGDGDFVALIQEVMRNGKETYVGALSSGLAPELRYTPDEFIDLDGIFFKKATKARAVRA